MIKRNTPFLIFITIFCFACTGNETPPPPPPPPPPEEPHFYFWVATICLIISISLCIYFINKIEALIDKSEKSKIEEKKLPEKIIILEESNLKPNKTVSDSIESKPNFKEKPRKAEKNEHDRSCLEDFDEWGTKHKPKYLEDLDAKPTPYIAPSYTECIVLDGYNMCYDNQNERIGISAILAIIPDLEAKYKEIIIFFDTGIENTLKKLNQSIKELKRYKKVKVMDLKSKADEYILTCASNMNASIISNDRYREFKDKFPELSLITYQIKENMIIIPELNILKNF